MCGTCGCDQLAAEPKHAAVFGIKPVRTLQIERDIFFRNNQFAHQNRLHFNSKGILALNLMSSPGSGKTTLLVETVRTLKSRYEINVIEGDQQTTLDADRIRATGVGCLQINTGKGCHLEADRIQTACQSLSCSAGSLLFIENVGNLVCPSAFDLGETARVVVLSVNEGEDKPLKYPDMFHSADLMLLNKVDLLPYVDFDVAKCFSHARRINSAIELIQVSAKTGEGLDEWYRWIEQRKSLLEKDD